MARICVESNRRCPGLRLQSASLLAGVELSRGVWLYPRRRELAFSAAESLLRHAITTALGWFLFEKPRSSGRGFLVLVAPRLVAISYLLIVFMITGCADSPRMPLPPSASDLPFMTSGQ